MSEFIGIVKVDVKNAIAERKCNGAELSLPERFETEFNFVTQVPFGEKVNVAFGEKININIIVITDFISEKPSTIVGIEEKQRPVMGVFEKDYVKIPFELTEMERDVTGYLRPHWGQTRSIFHSNLFEAISKHNEICKIILAAATAPHNFTPVEDYSGLFR